MSQRSRTRELCRVCSSTPAQTHVSFAGCCLTCSKRIKDRRLCVRCCKTVAQRNAKYLGLCQKCFAECNVEAQCRKCGRKETRLQSSISVWRWQNTDGLCAACFQELVTNNKCLSCYKGKRKSTKNSCGRCSRCRRSIEKGELKERACRRCKAMLSADLCKDADKLCRPCRRTLTKDGVCIQCLTKKRRNGAGACARCWSCAKKNSLTAAPQQSEPLAQEPSDPPTTRLIGPFTDVAPLGELREYSSVPDYLPPAHCRICLSECQSQSDGSKSGCQKFPSQFTTRERVLSQVTHQVTLASVTDPTPNIDTPVGVGQKC